MLRLRLRKKKIRLRATMGIWRSPTLQAHALCQEVASIREDAHIREKAASKKEFKVVNSQHYATLLNTKLGNLKSQVRLASNSNPTILGNSSASQQGATPPSGNSPPSTSGSQQRPPKGTLSGQKDLSHAFEATLKNSLKEYCNYVVAPRTMLTNSPLSTLKVRYHIALTLRSHKLSSLSKSFKNLSTQKLLRSMQGTTRSSLLFFWSFENKNWRNCTTSLQTISSRYSTLA